MKTIQLIISTYLILFASVSQASVGYLDYFSEKVMILGTGKSIYPIDAGPRIFKVGKKEFPISRTVPLSKKNSDFLLSILSATDKKSAKKSAKQIELEKKEQAEQKKKAQKAALERKKQIEQLLKQENIEGLLGQKGLELLLSHQDIDLLDPRNIELLLDSPYAGGTIHAPNGKDYYFLINHNSLIQILPDNQFKIHSGKELEKALMTLQLRHSQFLSNKEAGLPQPLLSEE